VLLAFTRMESNERKGMQRCADDFLRLLDKDPENARLLRLSSVVEVLLHIQHHQFAKAVDAVRAMAKTVQSPQFDFESASNLVALLALLARKAIQLDEVERVVERLAQRFCSNRSITELLAASASAFPRYMDTIREAQTQVLEFAESAVTLSMEGHTAAAVRNLIQHGKETLNARLVENAHQLLQKHRNKIPEEAQLQAEIDALRALCGPTVNRASLGETKRQAGGLALRTGKRLASDRTTS
jgi:hypothetical protein